MQQPVKSLMYILFIQLLLGQAFAYQRLSPEPSPLLYDRYPQSILIYYGVTVSDALLRLLQGDFHRYPENIQSVELSHTLAPTNPVRRFFNPVVGVVQLSGAVTRRHGRHESSIIELTPYLTFRWTAFPWNQYLNTSFAIGEGVSYASSIPRLESMGNDNTKRLLNYLLLEATFASPTYPRWQLVFRIHHRSGAYGLYGADNTGSNVIGVGLRYLFASLN